MNWRIHTILVAVLISACHSTTGKDTTRDETTIRGLFGFGSKNRQPTIVLRDGRSIDVKKYRIDTKTKTFIEELDKFRTLVSPTDVNSLPNPEKFWRQHWDSSFEIAKKHGIISAELFGLREYTGGGYGQIKDYFDPEKELTEASKKETEAILLAGISALNKLPRHQGTVFFGACLNEKVFLPLLKPAEVFWQNNFTSTSTDEMISGIFASGCRSGEGAFHFTVEKSSSGAQVSDFSLLSREAEVLFPPALPFRVKSFMPRVGEHDAGADYPQYNVVLEELGSSAR